MDVRQLEALLGAKLEADADVVAVYLFGSRARGTARDGSDVDLGLLRRSALPASLLAQPFELQAELSSELGAPVDIVVMNTAPVDLIHRILKDGKLVLERDRSRRIAFEVKARNEYFDLLPSCSATEEGAHDGPRAAREEARLHRDLSVGAADVGQAVARRDRREGTSLHRAHPANLPAGGARHRVAHRIGRPPG